MADAFATPKEAVKESDKYDSYGRYKLLHPKTGKKVNWTRATTFCKSIQDTFALSMWSQRMVLKGASRRPDIVDAAGTLDVKQDKDRLNGLVEEAKKAAGDKVAANRGTAVHKYTEERDLALAGVAEPVTQVPDRHRPTVDAYEELLKNFGLEPVPGLIEFTTAVLQYEIAGTSDRVYRVTKNMTFKLHGRMVSLYAGEYVIGDVKTGSDLSYGWMEIAIQLAIYAQGLNANGYWDWSDRQWHVPHTLEDDSVRLQVRTDVGIVPHLPVDRKEGDPLATLFAVDLDTGWANAVLCAQVRASRKESGLATPLKVAYLDLGGPQVPPQKRHSIPSQPSAAEAPGEATPAAPAVREATLEERARAVRNQGEASRLWNEFKNTPGMTRQRLTELTALMRAKLESHVEKAA